MRRISTGLMLSILVGSLCLASLVAVSERTDASAVSLVTLAARTPQEPKVDPPKPAPKLLEENRVKILRLQLQQERLKTEALQLQARMTDLQAQFDRLNPQLLAAHEEAFAAAKADPKDWQLDPVKLEFVARPTVRHDAVKDDKKP